MALVQECMFTVNGALIWARDTYARMGYARVDSAMTRLPSWVTCRYGVHTHVAGACLLSGESIKRRRTVNYASVWHRACARTLPVCAVDSDDEMCRVVPAGRGRFLR